MSTKHITDALLEEIFLFRRADLSDSQAKTVFEHCQSCPTCSELLEKHREFTREIESLKGLRNRVPNDTLCPSDEMWIKLASGIVNESDSRGMVEHAAECSECTKWMLTAHSYFGDEPESISGLESSTEAWQGVMASRMAGFPRASEVQMTRRFRWFWIPAMVVASVIVALIVFLNHKGSTDVEQLLGQAYGQKRTLELRFSGAQYGPVQVERGNGGGSLVNESPALLEAAAVIAKKLEREPNNPVWLDQKGRADLLAGHYQDAIKSFRKALDADPESAQFLTDTASAYFERGQVSDHPEDYGEAIDLLGKALTKKPDDPVILFNRALVREKMFLFRQAVEDWTRFLQIDPKSEWSKEANQRLQFLRQKLSDQKTSALQPALDPSALLSDVSGREPNLQSLLDQRPEDYLDRTIRKWLPEALASESNKQADASKSWRVLNALATVLSARHEDRWLSDLLETPRSEDLLKGIQALADAIEANAKGDFELARVKSSEAAHVFRRINNAAGESRAELETVYSLHRAELGKPCLLAADLVADHLSTHKYSWIQAQLELEQSSCWEQLGDFGRAARYSDVATKLAEHAGYGVLYLRAMGIGAGLRTNARIEYSRDWLGLRQYWTGTYPAMRAYQFYSDLSFPAEAAGEWHLALDLEKEAVATIALTEQRTGEALARQKLAKTALIAGDHDLAVAEFDRADRLYAGLPQNPATHTYQASAQIELAIMECARGNVEECSTHLARARSLLPQIVHYFIALNFYKAAAGLERLKGNAEKAEQAQRAAVEVAERGLASLRTEREREVWVRETRQVYTDLAESRWRDHDEEDALRIWEWYRGASVRATPVALDLQSARAVSLKSSDINFGGLDSSHHLGVAKELLRARATLSDKTVISYMQLPQGLIVWAFDDRGITSKWIPVSSQNLSYRVRHFHDECANPASDMVLLRRDARQLYNLLIAPVSDSLSDQRILVIEPDDSIADIAINALIDQEGRYLGRHHQIVFSPGLLYQMHLRRSMPLSAAQHALVVGSPAIASDRALEPLDDAIQEAEYIASRFEKATLLTGSHATLTALLSALPRAVIFHFGGHTEVRAGKTDLLVSNWPFTSNDTSAVLDDATLATINLKRLQVAILAGCSTASEDDAKAAAAENLVTGFLRASVPHVVASQWNINSRATTEFMRSFYDHLWVGKSVSASLQSAANDLASRADMAHPYYWAAFVAFGR